MAPRSPKDESRLYLPRSTSGVKHGLINRASSKRILTVIVKVGIADMYSPNVIEGETAVRLNGADPAVEDIFIFPIPADNSTLVAHAKAGAGKHSNSKELGTNFFYWYRL